MSDFETVKQLISIIDILRREHPGGMIKKVGQQWRCDPCFFCGHRDCFTFTSNRFHCFSCGEKGDAVDFIQKARHISNVDALRYLADIIGIPLGGRPALFKEGLVPCRTDGSGQIGYDKMPKNAGRMVEANRPSRIVSEVLRTEVIVDHEKRVALRRLRRIAADFYHTQLLSDPSALHYQIETRRHSHAILEACLVGFTAGNLIHHVAQQGEDPASLAEIGLVKPVGRVLREYLPRNCFVYPHFGDGQVLFFTVKDPTGQKKYQIPKISHLSNGAVMPLPDPSWVCFGQDSLKQDGCVLVEGENDLIAVLDAGEPYVAATIGNFARPEVTAWLTQNARGKTYFLCFDSDDAGAKYTDHYAKVIQTAGGKVRKIRL